MFNVDICLDDQTNITRRTLAICAVEIARQMEREHLSTASFPRWPAPPRSSLWMVRTQGLHDQAAGVRNQS